MFYIKKRKESIYDYDFVLVVISLAQGFLSMQNVCYLDIQPCKASFIILRLQVEWLRGMALHSGTAVVQAGTWD